MKLCSRLHAHVLLLKLSNNRPIIDIKKNQYHMITSLVANIIDNLLMMDIEIILSPPSHIYKYIKQTKNRYFLWKLFVD